MLEEVSIIEAIPVHLLELWEERAGIMEYDAGLTREDAEWQAFLCVQAEASTTPLAE